GLAALAAQLEGDWEARRKALEKLGRLQGARGQARAVALAVSHLTDEDCLVRRAAVSAGVRLVAPLPDPDNEGRFLEASDGEREGAASLLQQVLPMLEDQDDGVRRVALGAVGELACSGDSDLLGMLRKHLSDFDDDVRAAAAAAVGRLALRGDTQSLDAVMPLLEDDDESVRKAAVRAVARIARPSDEAAIAKLTQVARGDEDDDVRRKAASARAGLLAAAAAGQS
ncbi:unnamed protein product, partial [Polarella glacialis]